MAEKGLSKLLREATATCGRSRYQVAKDAGLSQIVLDRFLRGERDVTLTTADKIIEGLGRHLLWVQHLADMADSSPWFAVDCAWTSVENSTVVAVQNAQRYKRARKMFETLAERLDYLIAQRCITTDNATSILALEKEASVGEVNPATLTKRQARRFVAQAGLLVEKLWSI